MKRIKIMFIAILGLVICFNVYKSKTDVNLSGVLLENVEALASDGEILYSIGCYSSYTSYQGYGGYDLVTICSPCGSVRMAERNRYTGLSSCLK